MRYALAIDIGGTKIAAGIVNHRGKIIYKYIEPTNSRANSQDFSDCLKRIIRHTIKASGFYLRGSDHREGQTLKKNHLDSQIIGVGIGAPGPLDIKKGKIIFAPNLPKLKNFSIIQPLKKEFGLEVILENDANAAALAEWMFG
ncbi:MAG: ROK family protein, partial [Minisyncoccia bacterium]